MPLTALGKSKPSTGGVPFLTEGEWDAIVSLLSLSPRESEVVSQLLQGNTAMETAQGLGISIHTVHTHLGRIYRKLKVSNRCALVTQMFSAYVTLNRRT